MFYKIDDLQVDHDDDDYDNDDDLRDWDDDDVFYEIEMSYEVDDLQVDQGEPSDAAEEQETLMVSWFFLYEWERVDLKKLIKADKIFCLRDIKKQVVESGDAVEDQETTLVKWFDVFSYPFWKELIWKSWSKLMKSLVFETLKNRLTKMVPLPQLRIRRRHWWVWNDMEK